MTSLTQKNISVDQIENFVKSNVSSNIPISKKSDSNVGDSNVKNSHPEIPLIFLTTISPENKPYPTKQNINTETIDNKESIENTPIDFYEEKTVNIDQQDEEIVFELPLYLSKDVHDDFPDIIKKNYIIVKDDNDEINSTNYYFKLLNLTDRNYYFMKICMLNKYHMDEYPVYERINNEHRNIIKIIYKYRTKFYTVLIMPWYSNDLFELAKNTILTDKQIKNIFVKLVDAIYFLQQRRIIYTDLKLENVLVDSEMNPILMDMGLYIDVKNTRKFGFYKFPGGICTPNNRAPECITHATYSHKSVSWTLGFMLYAMVERGRPFDAKKFSDRIFLDPEMIGNYEKYKRFYFKPSYAMIRRDDRLDDLLTRMLEMDHIKRITVEEIYNHPWLNC